MKKIISFTLALFVALSIASFEVFADGEALKSPNPVPGRANPTGNILEFDDLTGAAPKGASGYSGVTGELFEADPIEEGDGWTVVFDAMVTKHEPGNNGQLAQFILSPDAGTHQMGYCFSRKHVAFEVSYAGWPTYSPSLITGYAALASTPYDLQKGTWARYAVQLREYTFSVWMNGAKMVEYEFTEDDLLDEGREEVRMRFILFYPTNLTMYLDNIVAAAPDFDVATETGTIYNVLTFDGDAENVPAATKIGKEPEEGEEDTRPVYSIYEEAEAAQGKDRPRTVYVDKDNNPFIYENILNNETGEYESQLVPFDKSIKILPTTYVKTFAEENGWFFAGGTGAYTIVKLEHELRFITAAAPSCTGDGHVEYYECRLCGKLFADSAAEREISADDVKIPAEHSLGALVPRKDATCVADGVRAHYRCTECGAYFDADDTTTPVEYSSLIIPSKDGAHDLRLVTAAAPSCTGDGHVEYYECRLCGKLFADSAAEREISADDVRFLGDGNRDGKINVKDIVIAIRAAIGQTMDNIDLDALDINRDGNVDVKDIIILIRHSTGYKQSYLIGYPMSSVPSAKPAIKVVSGVEFITYTSSITYKGQKDEYAYTAQNDGLVRIDISELKSGIYVDLYVYDRLGEEVVFRDYCKNNSGVSIPKAKAGDTYRIQVRYNNEFGDYVLTIGQPKPVIDVTSFKEVRDSIQYTEQYNYYTFTPSVDGLYRFDLNNMQSDFYVRLYLYDRLGYEVSAHEYCANNGITGTNLKAGEEYKIAVEYVRGFGDYSLVIGRQNPTVDISGLTEISDRITFKEQKNVYSFTAPSDGDCRFDITEMKSDVHVGLYVYDRLGYEVVSHGYCSNNSGITLNGMKSGETYKIVVVYITGFGDYTLTINH